MNGRSPAHLAHAPVRPTGVRITHVNTPHTGPDPLAAGRREGRITGAAASIGAVEKTAKPGRSSVAVPGPEQEGLPPGGPAGRAGTAPQQTPVVVQTTPA